MRPEKMHMVKYVYLACSKGEGLIKIGISENPERRMKALRTKNKSIPELVYKKKHALASMVEKIAHSILSEFNVYGEWFDICANAGIDAIDLSFLLARGKIQGSSQYSFTEQARKYRISNIMKGKTLAAVTRKNG